VLDSSRPDGGYWVEGTHTIVYSDGGMARCQLLGLFAD